MAFGAGLNDNDEVVSEINMVPLIDVMLVMLIIFILTVPVLTHAVKLDLPRAQNTPNLIKPETVNLSVNADGQVFWNENEVDETELKMRLEASAQRDPQPEIYIRGDRKVEYERVAQVMAAVQRSGMLKLGFVTNPGN
ncbi:MAG: biopolymer transporter ExbD [Chromatiales bacterium]|jgi:biopolymer transport protein ExbD|nr:biopolymer transporter ExbD [Chromatiales bacterium]